MIKRWVSSWLNCQCNLWLGKLLVWSRLNNLWLWLINKGYRPWMEMNSHYILISEQWVSFLERSKLPVWLIVEHEYCSHRGLKLFLQCVVINISFLLNNALKVERTAQNKLWLLNNAYWFIWSETLRQSVIIQQRSVQSCTHRLLNDEYHS